MKRDEAAAASAVLEALRARSQAVVSADVAYLAGVLAPEFKHIHATGRVEPRADYLASIASGKGGFTSVEPRAVEVNVYGSAAVAAGDIFIERKVEQDLVGRISRFVSVWHETDGRWQLTFWQMTSKQA
jgi:hypothetical protein